jgi:hypothetical protein
MENPTNAKNPKLGIKMLPSSKMPIPAALLNENGDMADNSTGVNIIKMLPATRFFNLSKKYYFCANTLISSFPKNSPPEAFMPTLYPISFLYFHTLELLFKSFLCVQGKKPPKIHDLSKLYEECLKCGLQLKDNYPFDLDNIVYLLDSANKNHEFRYYNEKSDFTANPIWIKFTANPIWIKEVLENFFQYFEPIITAYKIKNGQKSGVSKITMIVDRPVPPAQTTSPT